MNELFGKLYVNAAVLLNAVNEFSRCHVQLLSKYIFATYDFIRKETIECMASYATGPPPIDRTDFFWIRDQKA